MNESKRRRLLEILGNPGLDELETRSLGSDAWDSWTHIEVIEIVESSLSRDLTELELDTIETASGLFQLLREGGIEFEM